MTNMLFHVSSDLVFNIAKAPKNTSLLVNPEEILLTRIAGWNAGLGLGAHVHCRFFADRQQ